MDGMTIGTVGKSENSQTDVEREDQDAEKLCKSIKGFARRSRERHAILAEVGEEDQRALCLDDVTKLVNTR